jgi:hypothetical protein
MLEDDIDDRDAQTVFAMFDGAWAPEETSASLAEGWQRADDRGALRFNPPRRTSWRAQYGVPREVLRLACARGQ